MSQNQHNIHIEVSSDPSQDQQQQQTSPEGSGTSNGGNMMTQAEYLKYKQGDSNTNNYYGFNREVNVKPVCWVRAINIFVVFKLYLNLIFHFTMLHDNNNNLLKKDGKFAKPDPNNVFYVPNRNASNANNFYGFTSEPDVSPVVWLVCH